jgi:glycosyltransferase involved in cell wall biosynthesis
MDRDLIQVIIPVYKAEAFLERCLTSILDQSYRNYVVYMVDDCSPDESWKICARFAEMDKRFNLIRLDQNRGAAHARNCGLERADLSMGYIAFVDADDYLHPEYLEHLYRLLTDNQADFSWVSVHNTFEKTRIELEDVDFAKESTYTISGHDLLLREDLRIMYLMVWGKLFRSSLWEDVRFNEKYHFYEDGATTFKVIYKAEKAVVSDMKLYNYFYSADSATRSRVSEVRQRDGLATEVDKIRFYTEKHESDLLDMAYIAYLNTILGIMRQTDDSHNRQFRKEIWDLYKKNYRKVFRNRNISGGQKFKYFLYRLNPAIQELYLKIKFRN